MEQKIAAERKNCPDVVLKLSLIELEMFGARILTFKIDYSNHSGCFFFFFHCNARSCFHFIIISIRLWCLNCLKTFFRE